MVSSVIATFSPNILNDAWSFDSGAS